MSQKHNSHAYILKGTIYCEENGIKTRCTTKYLNYLWTSIGKTDQRFIFPKHADRALTKGTASRFFFSFHCIFISNSLSWKRYNSVTDGASSQNLLRDSKLNLIEMDVFYPAESWRRCKVLLSQTENNILSKNIE